MTTKRLLLHTVSRPPPCLIYRNSRPEAAVIRQGRSFTSVTPKNDRTNENNGSSAKSPNSNTNNMGSSFTSNSNPNEVSKFSSFASHWWDSRSNPLVGMNPTRIKFLRDVVETFQPSLSLPTEESTATHQQLPLHNKRILDIGCGGGVLTESLSRLGASLVVGVDASTHVVEVAKQHSFHENSRLVLQGDGSSSSISGGLESSSSSSRDIRYIGGITVEELASSWLAEHEKEQQASSSPSYQQHELFDIITALEIIEHVPNPSSLLHAARSLLKPNGILIVSTINRTVKSYGLAIVAAEYILGKVPVGTHTWDMFWSPTEVEQMILSSHHHLNNSGDTTGRMKQIALSGMVLQPPFINMEWKLDGRDTDVNWIGAYQKQQVSSMATERYK